VNRLLLGLHRRSREKRHRLFLRLMRPNKETRILNIGATGANTGLPEQLEFWYTNPERLTGGGPSFDEVSDYRASFPGVTPVVFDGCALPFSDRSFDIVYSNAVLEHLPGPEFVARFAAEVQRVGKAWFVATPNRWFPVDPHYHIPLVQFLSPEAQRRLVLRLGKVPLRQLASARPNRLAQIVPHEQGHWLPGNDLP
jgi:SAM-dependent methyltransferase